MASHAAIRLIAACLLLALVPRAAFALAGATADSTDRFPFVVEVRLNDHLICSGTVIYPRIVVTAAHCLQQKVYWRGGQFYTDAYLGSPDLSVRVMHFGRVETYAVAETAISPGWLALNDAGAERFPYDLALVITKQPIEVETPPSPLGAGATPPIREGLLVAFGGEHCLSAIECDDAGVRRFLTVAIKEYTDCFNSRGGTPVLPRAVWCMDSTVMPGDSGGALLVEAPDGELHYAGVISAQGGLPLELGAVARWRRSLAAGLDPNLSFIAKKARELGYPPWPD